MYHIFMVAQEICLDYAAFRKKVLPIDHMSYLKNCLFWKLCVNLQPYYS